MIQVHRSLTLVAALLVAGPAAAQWSYPPAPTSDAADTWHGRRHLDPYRPLENDTDKAVQGWYRAQADLTDAALGRIAARDELVRQWLDMDRRTPPRYRDFAVEGGLVFYRKTMGGETVGKLYVRKGWDGPEQLLFDPTTYKAGVTTTVESWSPSFDGRHVLLALSAGGAEWAELRVLRVEGRALLPESIPNTRGWGGWLPDGRSFLYDTGDVTDVKSLDIQLNRKVRLHRLGAPVAGDRDVLSNASAAALGITPKELPMGYVSELAPQLALGMIYTVQPELRIYVAPVGGLEKGPPAWRSLAQPADGLVRGFAIFGGSAYAVTHVGAPRYRLVRTSLEKPDWSRAETVLPEAADSIEAIAQSKDHLLVQYSNGITGRVVRVDLATGAAAELKLPQAGTVEVTCPDAHSNTCLVTVTGWTTPATLFEVDAARGTVKRSRFSGEVAYPEFADLVAEEVEVPGHDGALIPLSILRRKDLKLDGTSPCILEGYGAYGISYTPFFSIRHAIAARGVVVAYAHVRGGSEKGEAWYKAGYKSTKPNTWKDFIAAAEHLVKRGYTSPGRLAGRGTSAGGILISRAVTERPDLFAAAVVNVGLANALRAEFSPNGPVNTPEFGTVEDPAEAQALFEMDGLAHVQPGVRYPAVLGVAGWNDPRVAVWQPAKFVAAMQRASTSGRPALLKVNYDNGHFTEDKLVTFRNFADQTAFSLWQAGHPDFQPATAAGGK